MKREKVTRKKKASGITATEQVPESFESPESSNVAGAQYDSLSQSLTVRFKSKEPKPEAVYRSTIPVPPTTWVEFLHAPSKGAFYNQIIRPQFDMRLV